MTIFWMTLYIFGICEVKYFKFWTKIDHGKYCASDAK